MTKISGFIIALLFVGFFAGVFSLFIGGMSSEYDVSGYNATSFESFNKISELNNDIEDIQENLEKKTPNTPTDLVGAFFSNGYDALQISFRSFGIFNSMSNDALNMANVGPAGIMLKNVLIAVVLISLLFVLIYAITKVPL